MNAFCCYQGLHQHLQQEGNWFSQAGKILSTELIQKKTFSVDGQTRLAKSSS